MTRKQAVEILFRLINSNILNDEVTNELQTLANIICQGEFEKCDIDPRCKHGYPNYCEGCDNLNDKA